MTQQNAPVGEPLDERTLARKYGLRELVWPDTEQVKALSAFLAGAVATGKCGLVPKMAVKVMLEFLQGVLNRQNVTKGPHMRPEEFDALQTPYYLAARIVTQVAREKREQNVARGKIYQTTYVTLNRFIDLLRQIVDPASPLVRSRTLSDDMREVMEVLWDFAELYPEQRRKGRAM